MADKSPQKIRHRTAMPIMGSALLSEIPFAMIAPHEAQAQRNHGQSLERLAQRGGLAACEALDIIEGRRWGSAKPCIENERYLITKVRAWLAAKSVEIGKVTP
ncbi:hypothetical protein [Cupriavidus metallidurans]|uniref:hypothetical protein n=1 Tax=Cupriavidus metallidurans TaxID=119219 RepID=UPI001CCDBF2C|nr:hypothetical protein [Cupriavidus metallidurans]UBM12817.1 hypothetical protein LAI70_28090 [Cupriavidus metallidurans]